MSEAKFTPGPWLLRYAGNGEDGFLFRIDAPNGCGPGGSMILDDVSIEGSDESEEIANARLIAAAPELYEALKAAEEELRLIRAKDCDRVYDPTLRTRIGLALAKAEGK